MIKGGRRVEKGGGGSFINRQSHLGTKHFVKEVYNRARVLLFVKNRTKFSKLATVITVSKM